jgi:hypothetical protein
MTTEVDADEILIDPNRGRTAEGDLDPNQIATDLDRFGREYAEAYANAKLLEEQKSIVFSTLVLHYREAGPRVSRADAEDHARTSEEYSVHIETMVEARRRANIAKARWMAVQARFEAMRTAEATRRAELKAFGGSR